MTCQDCGEIGVKPEHCSRGKEWRDLADRLDAEASRIRAPFDARGEWRGADGNFFPEIEKAGKLQSLAFQNRGYATLLDFLAEDGDREEWFHGILGDGCEEDSIYSSGEERTLASMIGIDETEAELLGETGAECAVIWHSDFGDTLEFGTFKEWNKVKKDLEEGGTS